jgi:hypothetical protein
MFKGANVVLGLQFGSDYMLHQYFHTPNNVLAFLVSPYIHKVTQRFTELGQRPACLAEQTPEPCNLMQYFKGGGHHM